MYYKVNTLARLKFFKGSSSRLDFEQTPFSEGSFHLTTDDGVLYLDYIDDIDGEHKRLPVNQSKFVDKNITPTNLNNGNTTGSLRGINTLAEDESYAMGINAFAIGDGTKASGENSFVRGKYNIADENGEYNTIVGNGDADSNRKNIHTLDWEGNAWFSGDIYIGSTSGLNKDEGSKKLATEEYVNNNSENSVKKYFLIVETIKEGANYLLDGMTFDEIYEKFNAGNVNMVCHVDGTDYIPLLSVTRSSLIFSGIYNTTSVSLVFNSQGIGTLTSTYLADNYRFNSYYTKTETDKQIANLVNSAPETLDTLGELATALQENEDVVDTLNEAITKKQI